MLRKGMDMQKWYDDWTSVKDKASMLLSAYAKAYDEICQGYENGTRVRYKIDMSAKELYREVTMEEELEALRERYEARTNNLEELHRLSCSATLSFTEVQSSYHFCISIPLRSIFSGDDPPKSIKCREMKRGGGQNDCPF